MDWNDFDFSPEQDSEEGKIIKWVFNPQAGVLAWEANENGLPTHTFQISQEWKRQRLPEDVLGYGVPTKDGIELEEYGANDHPEALQAAKAELARRYPDQQITLPDQSDGNLGVDFIQAAYRPSALWAQTAFVSELTKPKLSRLKGLLSWRKAAEEGADKEGAMVALYLPAEWAKKLALKDDDAESEDDLHITLSYFEDKAVDRDDWDQMREIVDKHAIEHSNSFKGKISGVGIFQNEEGDVLWAAVSLPGLADFRSRLVRKLDDEGFTVSKDYDFVPHITLKYNFTGKPPRVPSGEIEIKEIHSVVAETRQTHGLQR